MNSHQQLDKWINSAPVVIFRSPVTEMDRVRRELNTNNIPFTEIELSMASPDERALFHQLKLLTHYDLLPQVFIHSHFIGGADTSLSSDAFASLIPKVDSGDALKKLTQSLGYLGIIPFLLFTLLSFVPNVHSWAIKANMIYGAVILTFIGAIHWGAVVNDKVDKISSNKQSRLLLSIIPSIIAWLALIDYFSIATSIGLLIVSVLIIHTYEHQVNVYPSTWYQTMRMRLSFGVIGLLGLSLLSIFLSQN